MKNKENFFLVLVAVLGIVVGALSVVTARTAAERTIGLKTEYEDWRKLNLVLRQVDANYVDSVDRKKITDAAITAALGALDPHSVYMPPVELAETESQLDGGFFGIGIQFNVPNDTAVVIEVIPGGPAEKAGLLAGDRIVKVDSTVIAGVKFPQDSMVRRMKGPDGTRVLITVNRAGETIPFDIRRARIPTYSVDAAFMVGDTTAYLRLSKFSRTTHDEVVSRLKELEAQGMRHLIFDVRDNSGGYFDQALKLSNEFLPKDSLVVYMEGLHRDREDCYADGRGHFKKTGLTVLINEFSASSAEIFAGAMQDNHRAVLVGRRSFGKGLVQEPINFTDGSGIRLTVARFYTPSGRCIQKEYSENYDYEVFLRYNEGEMVNADSMKVEKGGIVPDVFVPVDTTAASKFHIACNKKATAMRFASYYFDTHSAELGAIGDYNELLSYLDGAGLDKKFLEFAASRDSIVPGKGEWEASSEYLMTQIKALVGRYSKLGDNAFYHIYLEIDDVFHCATNM